MIQRGYYERVKDKQGCWYPLAGTESGKVLLSADFVDAVVDSTEDAKSALKPSNSSKSLTDSNEDEIDNKSRNINEIPDGKLQLNLIKAKELIKADLVGKSDPYAVLKYGNQKIKMDVLPELLKIHLEAVKNSLGPLRGHEVSFHVPEDNSDEVSIEVFDRFGKDKSMGKLSLKILELMEIQNKGGKWFSLTGVKSGQILLSVDLFFYYLSNLLTPGVLLVKPAENINE